MTHEKHNNTLPALKQANVPHPGILRRLAAMCYDACLVFALLLIATGLVLPLLTHHTAHINQANPWLQAYLGCIIAVFYLGFWVKRGQTLGMLAWHIVVQDQRGRRLNLTQACVRLLCAAVSLSCFGIGLLWQLFDEDNLSLYDRLSKTELIVQHRSARS